MPKVNGRFARSHSSAKARHAGSPPLWLSELVANRCQVAKPIQLKPMNTDAPINECKATSEMATFNGA
jgi:hypothetical protein